MKKILLLIRGTKGSLTKMGRQEFRDRVQRAMGDTAQVDIHAFGELVFCVRENQEAHIYIAGQRTDVADYDLVVFRTVGSQLEHAIAVAAYCRKRGVRYIDNYIPRIGNQKLSCIFVRWEHDLPVPATVFGTEEAVLQELASGKTVGWPVVVKADDGKKGRDNYLAQGKEDVLDILRGNPQVSFVVQSLIPNDGDYRVLVCNGRARLAFIRRAQTGSHLNNTSQGGVAEAVAVEDLPAGIRDLAERASNLEELAIAGADIIVDKHTGRPYILEINRAPQLTGGALEEEHIEEYAQSLKELLP